MALELLSDTLDPLVDTLTDCFKIGSKIPQVTVLSEKAGIIKVYLFFLNLCLIFYSIF